jgi:ribosomal protein S27E
MKKLTFEYVKEFIEKEGYKLLSDVYKNNSSKLEVQCPEGHKYSVGFNSFKNNIRCPYCYGNKKLTFEYVKEFIEKEGYKLLSTNYVDTRNKLEIQCPEGHIYQITFSTFKSGHRCKICSTEQIHIKQKHTLEYINKYINNFKYKLISNSYNNAFDKICVECPSGHRYYVKFNNFQQGDRCPYCSNINGSKAEKEIVKIIKDNYTYDIIENDRTQIINPLTKRMLELDIYLPDINKAIEYNGTYWHSKKSTVMKDKLKINLCKEKNICLLVISEAEWLKDKEKCLDDICLFINK